MKKETENNLKRSGLILAIAVLISITSIILKDLIFAVIIFLKLNSTFYANFIILVTFIIITLATYLGIIVEIAKTKTFQKLAQDTQSLLLTKAQQSKKAGINYHKQTITSLKIIILNLKSYLIKSYTNSITNLKTTSKQIKSSSIISYKIILSKIFNLIFEIKQSTKRIILTSKKIIYNIKLRSIKIFDTCKNETIKTLLLTKKIIRIIDSKILILEIKILEQTLNIKNKYALTKKLIQKQTTQKISTTYTKTKVVLHKIITIILSTSKEITQDILSIDFLQLTKGYNLIKTEISKRETHKKIILAVTITFLTLFLFAGQLSLTETIQGTGFVTASAGEYCYGCCTDAAGCDEAQCNAWYRCDNTEVCCDGSSCDVTDEAADTSFRCYDTSSSGTYDMDNNQYACEHGSDCASSGTGTTACDNLNYDGKTVYDWLPGEVFESGSSDCCGDDASENALYQNCDNARACTDDTGDEACCSASTDCVDTNCYTSGTGTRDVDGNGDDEYCSSAIWYDCGDTGDCDPAGEEAEGDSGQPCIDGSECTETCSSNDCLYYRNVGYSDCDGDGACEGTAVCDQYNSGTSVTVVDAGACDRTDGCLCNSGTCDDWDICVASTGCTYDSDRDNTTSDCYGSGDQAGQCAVSNGAVDTDMDGDGDNDYCVSNTWYDCSTTTQCDPAGEYAEGESSNACSGGVECTEFCTGNDCEYYREPGYSDCDTDGACDDGAGKCAEFDASGLNDGTFTIHSSLCDAANGCLCSGTCDQADPCVTTGGCPYDSDRDNQMGDCGFGSGEAGNCYVDTGSVAVDMDGDGDNDYCSSNAWYDCNTDSECDAGEQCIANDCIADPDCSGKCFYIRDATSANMSIFSSTGNVFFAGTITESSVGTPDGAGDFVVKSSAGAVIAWLDDDNGNIRLAGTVSQNQGSCSSAGSFQIKNSAGTTVAHIDNSGNICATGGVYGSASL